MMQLGSMDMKLLKIELKFGENRFCSPALKGLYYTLAEQHIPYNKFSICKKFKNSNIIDHRPVYDAIREYNYESLRFCNIT